MFAISIHKCSFIVLCNKYAFNFAFGHSAPLCSMFPLQWRYCFVTVVECIFLFSRVVRKRERAHVCNITLKTRDRMCKDLERIVNIT